MRLGFIEVYVCVMDVVERAVACVEMSRMELSEMDLTRRNTRAPAHFDDRTDSIGGARAVAVMEGARGWVA